jgi:hypothetical protein
MNIPIDGTYQQFEQKILSKGFSKNNAFDSAVNVDAKFYKGTYEGEKAILVVRENGNHKICTVKMLIRCENKTNALAKKNYYIEKYIREYNSELMEEGGIKAIPVSSFRTSMPLGFLNVFVDYLDIIGYVVEIEYYDLNNNGIDINGMLDDYINNLFE